jgi:hypothetical protein
MVLSASAIPTSATSYQLGVQTGNYADYSVSVTSIPGAARAHLSVSKVSGTVATLDLTFTYSNGSLVPNGFFSSLHPSIDVASTNGSQGLFVFLIAANLTVGDAIYPTSSMTLNGNSTMIATGVNRTVNHFQMAVGGTSYNIYWDKDTGILVQMNWDTDAFDANFTMSGTNMWSAGIFNPMTAVVIGAVAAIMIVGVGFVLLRKRK